MADVSIVPKPDLATRRRELMLTEDSVGHYQEFREFFVRSFDLARKGLSEPGYVSAPSGMLYVLVFVGRSGEPFPSGVEVHALPDALEPLDETAVDRDLWAILNWMVDGVGPPWTRADLDATGRLYRIPATQ